MGDVSGGLDKQNVQWVGVFEESFLEGWNGDDGGTFVCLVAWRTFVFGNNTHCAGWELSEYSICAETGHFLVQHQLTDFRGPG